MEKNSILKSVEELSSVASVVLENYSVLQVYVTSRHSKISRLCDGRGVTHLHYLAHLEAAAQLSPAAHSI